MTIGEHRCYSHAKEPVESGNAMEDYLIQGRFIYLTAGRPGLP